MVTEDKSSVSILTSAEYQTSLLGKYQLKCPCYIEFWKVREGNIECLLFLWLHFSNWETFDYILFRQSFFLILIYWAAFHTPQTMLLKKVLLEIWNLNLKLKFEKMSSRFVVKKKTPQVMCCQTWFDKLNTRSTYKHFLELSTTLNGQRMSLLSYLQMYLTKYYFQGHEKLLRSQFDNSTTVFRVTWDKLSVRQMSLHMVTDFVSYKTLLVWIELNRPCIFKA